MEYTTLELTVVGKQGVTLLPRCLQVLSRRGCMVTKLTTEPAADDQLVRLRLDVQAPTKWEVALPGLIERLHDVEAVSSGGAQ